MSFAQGLVGGVVAVVRLCEHAVPNRVFLVAAEAPRRCQLREHLEGWRAEEAAKSELQNLKNLPIRAPGRLERQPRDRRSTYEFIGTSLVLHKWIRMGRSISGCSSSGSLPARPNAPVPCHLTRGSPFRHPPSQGK